MECPQLPDEDDYCIEQALMQLFKDKAAECDSFFKLDQKGDRVPSAGCAVVTLEQMAPTRPRAAPIQTFDNCTQIELVRTVYGITVKTGGCSSEWTELQAKRLAGQVHRLILRCLCEAQMNYPNDPIWKLVSISRLETESMPSGFKDPNNCISYSYRTQIAFDYECDWCK